MADDDDDESGEEESGEEESGEEESGEESEEEELNIDEVGRVAVGGQVNYTTRCFDDAVALEPGAEAALYADCETVFTARANGDGEGLSSGCTFWIAAGEKPKSTLERLALRIFQFQCALLLTRARGHRLTVVCACGVQRARRRVRCGDLGCRVVDADDRAR